MFVKLSICNGHLPAKEMLLNQKSYSQKLILEKDDYDNQALKLSIMFQDNFKQYTGEGFTDYTQFGPKIIL